jgi:hypothetical protein
LITINYGNHSMPPSAGRVEGACVACAQAKTKVRYFTHVRDSTSFLACFTHTIPVI